MAAREMTLLQRRIVLALAIVIGVTRFFAVAHSLFDWDEALFSLGVREYEVQDHRPHPPGYPLFIAAAKVFAATGLDAFRSLQIVVVLGALLIFPALFWLAREIGFDVPTAAGGAAVYAFLPNVWVYGGTGFSDVPSTAIVFVACALLLRGRRDTRAYIAGAIVLGIAAGFRPANLLVGAVPALLATWHQLRAKSYRAIVTAALLGAVIVAGTYLGAGLASRGISAYIEAVRAQSRYVRDIDSWRNPQRPPLFEVAKSFFLWPVWHQDALNAIAIAGVLSLIAALVRRRLAPLLTLAIFLPLAITSWLNLDINTAGRYAIGYMATHALLAADGFRLFGRRVQIALCTVAVLVFLVWTWPGLRLQRTTATPPIAALQWVRDNVPPSTAVYVHSAYGPQSTYVLQGRPVYIFEETEDIPLAMGDAWIVDWRVREGSQSFVWPHKTLWKIVRRRSFEASVSRAAGMIRFGDGWHDPEGTGTHPFRWMKKEGVVMLPSIRGNGVVTMRGQAPVEVLGDSAHFDVYWNGQHLDRIVVTSERIERSWTLPSRAETGNELRIVASMTVVPSAVGKSSDSRELGLKLDKLSWMPVN